MLKFYLPAFKLAIEIRYLQVSQMARLLLLVQELPDPGQEIWIQQLSEFRLFKKLPLEVRITIWHINWPRRIDTIKIFSRFCNANKLPISAQVHQESRKETLKQYRAFHFDPDPEVQRPRTAYKGYEICRPPNFFVLGPEDTFRTHFSSVQGSEILGYHLGIQEPVEQVMNHVRFLELSCFLTEFIGVDGQTKQHRDVFKPGLHGSGFNALALFTNLKGLKLVVRVWEIFRWRCLGMVRSPLSGMRLEALEERIKSQMKVYFEKSCLDLGIMRRCPWPTIEINWSGNLEHFVKMNMLVV